MKFTFTLFILLNPNMLYAANASSTFVSLVASTKSNIEKIDGIEEDNSKDKVSWGIEIGRQFLNSKYFL